MSIRYQYNVTGAERKALAGAVSEIVGKPAVYQKAPSFAYTIGPYSISRNGTLTCFGQEGEGHLEHLVSGLQKRGYVPEAGVPQNDSNTLTIEMPKDGFDENACINLEKIIASKKTVLQKALGAESLKVIFTEGTIRFPWFTLCGIEGEADAYSRLAAALCKMAKNQKRVTAKERDCGNDKYVMRLFLIRLGFIGDEYKPARKILLQNLAGNGSWKSGHASERPSLGMEAAGAASSPEFGGMPAEKEGGEPDGRQ